MRHLRLFALASFLISCTSNFDQIQKNNYHKLSPDKNALIYQSSYSENGKHHIALISLVRQKGSEGGSGILDIILDEMDTINFYWTTDSILDIIIPKNAEIIRQENQLYFLGRTTNINYSYPIVEIKKKWDNIVVDNYSVIIHQLDSVEIEIEKAKNENEEDFYSSNDDLLWYTNKLTETLDSLRIPFIYTSSDFVKIVYENSTFSIEDTSTNSYYTFYEVYNDKLIKLELFELMEKFKIK